MVLVEHRAVAKAALCVSVQECVKAMTPEKLVPGAMKVTEATASVERAEAVPSPPGEDVNVGEGWRVGGRVVR